MAAKAGNINVAAISRGGGSVMTYLGGGNISWLA